MGKLFICILVFAFTATGCSSSNLTLKGDIQNNLISAVSTVPGKIIQMNSRRHDAGNGWI